jgi:hypothetical protein
MLRFILASLALATLALSAVRADDVNGRPRTDQAPQPARTDSVTSLPAGDYVGRLLTVNPEANTIVLQTTTQRQVLKNPNGPTRTADQIADDINTGEQKIGKMYTDSAISRSPQEYERKRQETQAAVTKFQLGLQKKLDQMYQQIDNPQPIEYVTLTERKDISLAAKANVHVRLRDLPTIDDSGNVHSTWTAEEIRKLKGKEPFEPGYDGKLRDLMPGDFVRITVAPAAAAKPGEKKTEEAKTAGPANVVTNIAVITKDQAERFQAKRQ